MIGIFTMTRKEDGKLKEQIVEYAIKDMNDFHEFVKMLTVETIETTLDAEFENDFGYSKYTYKNKQISNNRNNHSIKMLQDSKGKMEIEILCDWGGEFEPQLVKNIKQTFHPLRIKSFYCIQKEYLRVTFKNRINVEDSRVSKITDKILLFIKE